jgi:hypothetical protein
METAYESPSIIANEKVNNASLYQPEPEDLPQRHPRLFPYAAMARSSALPLGDDRLHYRSLFQSVSQLSVQRPFSSGAKHEQLIH